MEISNKAFGIICVGVIVVTVYVRAQSVHSDAAPVTVVQAPKVVAQTPQRRHGIPDSAMPPDQSATTADDQPIADDAPITLSTAPVDQSQNAAPAAKTPAPNTAPTDGNDGQEDDLTYTDDIGPMAEAAPTNNAIQLSDRDMLRIMLGSMPVDQQESFRLMWFNMTPDDRQGFLDQLRDTQNGG